MSPLLWVTVVIAILGCVMMIVIAIVGTIENKDRRQVVAIIIYIVALATGLICSILFSIHHARHVDDVPPSVQTDRISEG